MHVNFPEMIAEIVSVHVPKILSGVVKPILFHAADWGGVSATAVCATQALAGSQLAIPGEAWQGWRLGIWMRVTFKLRLAHRVMPGHSQTTN